MFTVRILALAIAALASSGGAPARGLTLIDFPGGHYTTAYGINAQGDIVGTYQDSSNHNHGYLLHKGGFTTIDFPGASDTSVRGINNRGDIVGSYTVVPPASLMLHGFLLRAGEFITIDYPGSPWTEPEGINDAGKVVGAYGNSPFGPYHGFRYSDGGYTSIDAPGSIYTEARGINNQGEIVGNYMTSAQPAPLFNFMLRQGQYINISVNQLPGPVKGINSRGEMLFGTGVVRNGVFTPFPSGYGGYGINERGQTVGIFSDSSYGVHGFLAD